MSEQTATKVTESELNEVRRLSEDFNRLTMEIGELNIAMIDLEAEIEKKKNQVNELRTKETKMGKDLEEKYGKGRLNLADGSYLAL